jgi:hypothetical protein
MHVVLVSVSLALGLFAARRETHGRAIAVGGADATALVLNVGEWRHLGAGCRASWSNESFTLADAKAGWRLAGRSWVTQHSGLAWNGAKQRWLPAAQAAPRENRGLDAYYLEYALGPAVHLAAATADAALMRELAEFFLTYRTMLIGRDTVSGLGRATDPPIAECELCNAQFLYAAARLTRAVAEGGPGAHGERVTDFARVYTKLIVRDYVVRWIEHVNRNYWRAPELDSAYLSAWKQLSAVPKESHGHYRYAVRDNDLWIIAIVAEILAARDANSALIDVSPADEQVLRRVLTTGVALIRSRMTEHPETRDASGRLVGSLSLFDGDFDDFPDLAFAGDTGRQLPTSSAAPSHGVGWDVSHATRLPQVLRTLDDTRHRTGVEAFTQPELRLLVNQFVYRVSQGDLGRPRLANYMDGSDGWNRVGYHGPAYGYPPSKYCDSRSPSRPCLQTIAFTGWGQLALANDDLCELEAAVASLSLATDTSARAFAGQYFTFNNQPFAIRQDRNEGTFPFLLYWILSDNAENLPP